MLVRDPRSILASRAAIMTDSSYQARRNMKVQDEEQLLGNLNNVVCAKSMENVAALRKHPWLSQKKTNEVAEWLGDIYYDQMESAENVGQSDEKALGPIAKALEHPGRFATFGRNTSLIPYKWMKTLNYTTIDKIQNLCSEYMDHFGYGKIAQLPADHSNIIRPVQNTEYLHFL
ncbi:Oidioi.mRNA.OKI2018_I69.XSR.g14745.t1.cds [Oikopleura dioica]|uniref:Oidioi.mRNA.OKI2018_I69.XSR.g14745.t1.cds n=1 Tax=Oikopleura dioica TaxID=34765 RepID=A0ABN7SAP0_OIKDI|nr:Oidioi.mRNA.OKI2018_I69.XSR.g14745.t1.cds [Oikopleura dioica]